jgi:UDP-N-acetylglucosamine 1-carboxyvinyltransferase
LVLFSVWKRIYSKPGGDKIGRRRLDTHFEGFINLGAKFRYNRDHFYGEAQMKLTGADMLLDEASVTGTANIVMAAVWQRKNNGL